ncbi:MAG: hypothetical protein K0B11_02770 [Mariniphaga sp.]|nr:hypothetical protein [Mariniphaga sp.]
MAFDRNYIGKPLKVKGNSVYLYTRDTSYMDFYSRPGSSYHELVSAVWDGDTIMVRDNKGNHGWINGYGSNIEW